MPINEVLQKELIAIKTLVEGNSLAGLNAAQDFIPKAIAANQRRLTRLRSTEMRMLQKLRRQLSMQEVDGDRADFYMKAEPMQSYLSSSDLTDDPHQYITYDIDKLSRLTIGIQELIRDQKAIAAEIKQRVAAVRDLNNELLEVNEKIAASQGAKVAIRKDRIAQRLIAELYFLYEIHIQYRDYTRDAVNNESYTSDQKIVALLENLQLKFFSFYERNPFALNGSLVLDVTDPGSAANGVALTELIEKLRAAANPGEKGIIDRRIKKYADNLVKNLNDPEISVGTLRRDESVNTPEADDSLHDKTKNQATMVQYTQKSVGWWTKWSGTSFSEVATAAFKWRTKALYGGLPFCGEPTPSEEEQDRADYEAVKKVIDTQAAAEQAAVAESFGVDTSATSARHEPAGAPPVDPKAIEETKKAAQKESTALFKTVSKYLKKDYDKITEQDLVTGYIVSFYDYKLARGELTQTNPLKDVKDANGVVTKVTKEQKAQRDKLIVTLRTKTQQAAIRTVDYKKALISWREVHDNFETISQYWWDKPSEDEY